MSRPLELESERPADLPAAGLLGQAQSLLDRVNTVLVTLSAVAAAAAGGVLTWEVAGRYFLKIPSDWQDELSIFLLVGATFASAGWIQARRGHVSIDALHHILPPRIDGIRRFSADVVSFAFCAFFCLRCWALLLEAWQEGQTSDSAWGPPLWIPYGLMAGGMSILVVQILVQVLSYLAPVEKR